MDFTTLSGEALTEALALDFASLDNDALTSAHAERTTALTALAALETPTIAQVADAQALFKNLGEIEKEQSERAKEAKKAAETFAAIRASLAASAEGDDEESEEESEAEESAEETDEAEEGGEAVEASAEESEEGDEGEAVVTASMRQTINAGSVARKVGRKTTRPDVGTNKGVRITAAADIPNVPMASELGSMSALAEALMGRAKGFSPFNQQSAQAAHSRSNGQPVINKYAVASVDLDFAANAKASTNRGDADGDHSALRFAIEEHNARINAQMNVALAGRNAAPAALSAAGWCSPSEVVYNWIADFVVDGLISMPEVGAPRGGLMITEGPQLLQTTYADPTASFGFGGTETEAIAGDFNKTCETIVCPEFVDHRLDFTGYCWKIPLLTEATYKELVADALRVSDVAFAHKMNARKINDILDLSTTVAGTFYGGSFTDSIEAFTQIAVKERRWWNIGVNAVMEVKLPQFALDVFKFDMARRSGLALDDIATEQKVAAHFANHKLSVEYVSDLQDLSGPAAAQADWPGHIKGIMYPAGTFATASHPVINISAVHDAASLAENEYTGVFFEQGYMTFKRGYRSHQINIPVCTSGTTGANAFECVGGSF